MAIVPSTDVLNRVNRTIVAESTDLLARSTPFLETAKKLGKVHYYGGPGDLYAGSYGISFPVEVAPQTLDTDLSADGAAQIDLTIQATTAKASFDFATVCRPVVLLDTEALNTSSQQLVKLAETRLKQAVSLMGQKAERQIIRGGEAKWSNLGTLNGIQTNGFAGGFLEDLAPGSQVRSVGGVSKSTYSTVPGWQNQFVDVGGNFATNGIAKMYELETAASFNRDGLNSDGSVFHVIVLHQATMNLLKAKLQTQVRYMKEEDFAVRGSFIEFLNAACYASPWFTDGGNITGGSSKVLSGYALNLDHIKPAIHRDADFKMGAWERSPEQAASICQVKFQGALITHKLGMAGVIVDAVA